MVNGRTLEPKAELPRRAQLGNRKIRKCTIPEFPIRNLKMDDPKDEFPSDRPFLNFGLEIQESCTFEFSDFPIPVRRGVFPLGALNQNNTLRLFRRGRGISEYASN